MESSNQERTASAHKRPRSILPLPSCKEFTLQICFLQWWTSDVPYSSFNVFQKSCFSKRVASLFRKKVGIFFLQLASLQSLQGASIWSRSQTKHNPIHTATLENRFADQTVSSVRCVQSIIDQLMPYNVLPSVINGIHKHCCWNYATILLMLNALQNTDHFPNIIMFMITML